jgi:RNA ligase
LEYPHIEQVNRYVADGDVSARRHPRLPLTIYNYTGKVTFKPPAEWDEALRDCRGLVLDDSGHIAARGFRKFWNLGQTPIPGGEFEAWEKVDGSLILSFQYDGELVCASRGSFTSEQAQFATEWFRETGQQVGLHWTTTLSEAVYPDNRIVVDYKGESGCVLLNVVGNGTGALLDWDRMLLSLDWALRGGRVAKHYGFHDNTASLPTASNSEGYVLRFMADNSLHKVKFDEYVRLHRLIFQTTTERLWEMLRDGRRSEWDGLDGLVPADLKAWGDRVLDDIAGEHALLISDALSYYQFLSHEGLTRDRKALALRMQQDAKTLPDFYSRLLPLVFLRHDGKPIDEKAWKAVRPENRKAFREDTSDAG